MVQKALITAMEDDAHVGDPGVDHTAEDEVNDAVTPRKGNRSGSTVSGQLP